MTETLVNMFYIMSTIAFTVFIFGAWRTSINVRKERRKQIRREVDAFFAEIEREHPGTLERWNNIDD